MRYTIKIIILVIVLCSLTANIAYAGELHDAAKKGDLATVQKLLSEGADVNAQTSDGGTALMLAALAGHTEIAALLLKHGADINVQKPNGWTALINAANKGHAELVNLLLENGADIININHIPELMRAIIQGDVQLVKQLIENGADVNSSMPVEGQGVHTALMRAISLGHPEIVKLLLEHGADVNSTMSSNDRENWTALWEAFWQGDIESVKLLLEHGANVNSSVTLKYPNLPLMNDITLTPLISATSAGQIEVVTLLLAHGADVNSSISSDGYDPMIMGGQWPGNQKGWTPLMEASWQGHTEIVKLLLEHDANVDSRITGEWDTGQTALIIAVRRGHPEIVKLLLAYGADVNSPTSDGWTAFMSAVFADPGHSEIIQELLTHGANANSLLSTGTYEGWTALHLVVFRGHTEIVKLLLERGADVNSAMSAEGKEGWTALMVAVEQGHSKIVELLLEHGADMNIRITAKKEEGQTALTLALEKKQQDIVGILLKHCTHIPIDFIQTIDKHYSISKIHSLAFGSDGYAFVSIHTNGISKRWKLSTGRMNESFHIKKDAPIESLDSTAFSPTAHYAMSASQDNTLKLWQTTPKPFSSLVFWENFIGQEEIKTFEGLRGKSNLLTFSPDGQYALSAGFDGMLQLWSVKLRRTHPLLKFWRKQTPELQQPLRTFSSPVEKVSCLAFSPDGDLAIAGNQEDHSLTLWEIESGQILRTFHGHTDMVTSVAVSPDGKYIISGGKDGTLRLWNFATGSEIVAMLSFADNEEWLTMTPQGYYTASKPQPPHKATVVTKLGIGIPESYHRPDIVELAIRLGDSQQAVEQTLHGADSEGE